MYVQKGNGFLSDFSLRQIGKKYDEEKNVKAKIRLQCALLRKKGRSQPYISEATGLSITTISDILRRFEKRGIDGCYAIKQKGQPKKLSSMQRVKLKKIILNSPIKSGLPFVIWTTKLVQYIIHKDFKVDYVAMQVYRLLKSIGISMQKARPEHIKANKKLQTKFKKNFDAELKYLEKVDMRSYFWTKAPSNLNRT